MQKNSHRSGFTLVELSIVLAIIGLIVGAVLSGKELIRSAEVRSSATDAGRYAAAFGQFVDKFNALPGDWSQAAAYWGSLDAADPTGTSTTCFGTRAPLTTASTATCSGNGDGYLNAQSGYQNEIMRVWQHLSNAGLIEGKYTGRSGSNTVGSSYVVQDITSTSYNTPATKVKNLVFQFWFFGKVPATIGITFAGDYGHIIEAINPTTSVVYSPKEAYYIDKKLDDGIPGQGKIMTWASNSGSYVCVTTTNITTSEYAVSVGDITCPLYFKLGY